MKVVLLQMYWTRESGAGEWWVGAVAEDRAAGQGGNVAALADPYGCGGQWDRLQVAWQGESGWGPTAPEGLQGEHHKFAAKLLVRGVGQAPGVLTRWGRRAAG